MRTANEDGIWGAWRPYAATISQTLSAGYGTKGVFLQVRDGGGQTSSTIYHTLSYQAGAVAVPPPADAAPVTTAVTLPAQTASQLINVSVAATDDHGVAQMRLANEDGTWKAWQPYAANVTWTLTGGASVKGVFVQVKDTAGQESNVMFRTTLCTPCTAPAQMLAARVHVPAAVMRHLTATRRVDHLRGTRKADAIDASQFDHVVDTIDCGAGTDSVLKQPEDITRNCEHVSVVRQPTA